MGKIFVPAYLTITTLAGGKKRVVQAYRNEASGFYATGDGLSLIISMFCVGDRNLHFTTPRKGSAHTVPIDTTIHY